MFGVGGESPLMVEYSKDIYLLVWLVFLRKILMQGISVIPSTSMVYLKGIFGIYQDHLLSSIFFLPSSGTSDSGVARVGCIHFRGAKWQQKKWELLSLKSGEQNRVNATDRETHAPSPLLWYCYLLLSVSMLFSYIQTVTKKTYTVRKSYFWNLSEDRFNIFVHISWDKGWSF